MSRVRPSEPPRQRDPRVPERDHLAMVRRLPCLVCRWPAPSDPHHIKPASRKHGKGPTGTHKAHDCWTVPLCRRCHESLHHRGNEMLWWQAVTQFNPFDVARALFLAESQEEAERIVRRGK